MDSPLVPWLIGATAVFGTLTVVFGGMLWSANIRLRTHWTQLEAIPRDDRFPAMIAALSMSGLTDGNDVQLLRNGVGYFPTLLEEIARATSSVHFETYLWKTGECSARLVAALSERARAGLKVRVMLDGIGGTIEREEKEALERAGVSFTFYNPARLRNLGALNTRDHRKLAVIDGRVGFVGGHCITDDWLGDAEDRKHFRDISARVEGPIVTQLQGAFSENWTEAAGEVLAGLELFPEQPAKGSVRAHLAYLNLGRRASSVKVLHHLAFAAAQHDLCFQNPYFLPDSAAKDALCRAAARGVRVRVMIPTRAATDAKLVHYATSHGLRPLLEGGVEIYQYDRTLLHQKVFVVDGEWAGIGSTNLDDRSMAINEEITMSIFDRGIAAELLADFEADLAFAKRVTLEEWRARGPSRVVKGWFAWHLRDQL